MKKKICIGVISYEKLTLPPQAKFFLTSCWLFSQSNGEVFRFPPKFSLGIERLARSLRGYYLQGKHSINLHLKRSLINPIAS